MKVISSINGMQNWSKQMRCKGKTIGFVPMMGYLHEGHLSLLRKAREENDYLVMSIFVNPTQFGPKEDLGRYPRDFGRDKKLAKLCGVDVIFYPEAKKMYPAPYKTYVEVEDLSDVLCGKSRPGHFRGVTTVVLKLFNIVLPNTAYFGWKDAQQAIIINKMVKDLNLPIKIKTLPIAREENGLALSSRNTYLKEDQRRQAIILDKALQVAVGMIQSGYKDPRRIVAKMRKMIKSQKTGRIDYVEIVDMNTLKPVKKIKGRLLICLAVFFGKTRLIDNAIICA
ncbi:MAG: pantoate--beta-alanine ligase [Candidatus Omnitrophota bacterium]|nr:MAG: pantoate--beta-alanine ligase [Candidatus Omnitrophota bacterium]